MIEYDHSGDGSDGNLECAQVTDPTVTRNCAKPLELAFGLGDSNFDSDSKTVQSDGRKSSPAGVDIDKIISC